MDTGHLVGNVRVLPKKGSNRESDGDGVADVTCYTIGSHYRTGEALNIEKTGFMASTRWKAEVVKEGEDWKIRKAELKVLWAEGDASIMKGEH